MCRQETTMRFWGWKGCEGQASSHRAQACLCRPAPPPALQPPSGLGRWGGGLGEGAHMEMQMQTVPGDARSACLSSQRSQCIPLWVHIQALVWTRLHEAKKQRLSCKVSNCNANVGIQGGLRRRIVPTQLTAVGNKTMAHEFTHVGVRSVEPRISLRALPGR